MAPIRLDNARIWLAPASSAPERFAANELQSYLQRMYGISLPIEFAVSIPPLTLALAPGIPALPSGAPLAPDASRIETSDTGIFLQGGSPRAVLDAAYAALEQLGCRWSLHGPGEEYVPTYTGKALSLNATQSAPPFRTRGYCSDLMTWHYTEPEHFKKRLPDDHSFIDWMGKSGANTFFFIRHPFDTQSTITELLPDFQRRGIQVEYGGHIIPLLLPRELFAQRPDYFPASASGERSSNGNLCASSEGALATVSQNAVQFVCDFPETSVLHVWGMDVLQGGWCQCPSCASLGPQEQSLRVCNAIAAALAASGSPRPVCYLAYHDTLDANVSSTPHPNVLCEFAPRERCYGHALNDPDCDTNRRYARALEAYVHRFDGRVRLFEYYGDAILYCGCAVPLTEIIRTDMAYYRGLGIHDVLMLQFGKFSAWAYPMNFLAFAAACRGELGHDATAAYSRRFGEEAAVASAIYQELETALRPVVTYGDLRLKPRDSAAAQRLHLKLGLLVPELCSLAARLADCDDPRLQSQATLLRYTQTLFAGVARSIEGSDAGVVFAEALQFIDSIASDIKGTWGELDLPILHSIHSAGSFFPAD